MPTKSATKKKTVSTAKKAATSRNKATVKQVPAMDLDAIRKSLWELRDRVTGQISFLSDDANHKDDTPTDDRTDDFDREFAFNLVSTEQDSLYEIDAALRRLDQKVYGRCESCNGSIEKNRLNALPFARHCLTCQADLEKGVDRRNPGLRSPAEDLQQHHFEDLEATDTE